MNYFGSNRLVNHHNIFNPHAQHIPYTCLRTNSFLIMFFSSIFSFWVFIGKNILLILGQANWYRAASSEFVSLSIPSWQILTAHAQPFTGARDLAFCLKVPLDSLLVWASSRGSGKTARMRSLAWTFVARTGDKYQIRLTRPYNEWDTAARSRKETIWSSAVKQITKVFGDN